MPAPCLSALQILSHLSLTTIVEIDAYHDTHFTVVETGADIARLSSLPKVTELVSEAVLELLDSKHMVQSTVPPVWRVRHSVCSLRCGSRSYILMLLKTKANKVLCQPSIKKKIIFMSYYKTISPAVSLYNLKLDPCWGALNEFSAQDTIQLRVVPSAHIKDAYWILFLAMHWIFFIIPTHVY